jgi:hypothetical protein
MGQAGENPLPQGGRGRAPDATLADQEDELFGVGGVVKTGGTTFQVLVEGFSELLTHLIVDEEEHHFSEPFTVHLPLRPGSGPRSTYLFSIARGAVALAVQCCVQGAPVSPLSNGRPKLEIPWLRR